jgi:hypothetical protein
MTESGSGLLAARPEGSASDIHEIGGWLGSGMDVVKKNYLLLSGIRSQPLKPKTVNIIELSWLEKVKTKWMFTYKPVTRLHDTVRIHYTTYRCLFLSDMINPSTVMLLVNAIYFKGLWRYPFNETDTKEGVFQVTPTQTVTVPFMSMERDLYWTESAELDAGILRLPYMVSVGQCND